MSRTTEFWRCGHRVQIKLYWNCGWTQPIRGYASTLLPVDWSVHCEYTVEVVRFGPCREADWNVWKLTWHTRLIKMYGACTSLWKMEENSEPCWTDNRDTEPSQKSNVRRHFGWENVDKGKNWIPNSKTLHVYCNVQTYCIHPAITHRFWYLEAQTVGLNLWLWFVLFQISRCPFIASRWQLLRPAKGKLCTDT